MKAPLEKLGREPKPTPLVQSQTFLLPWPISTNRIWRNYAGQTILASEARNWTEHAGWLLKEQKARSIAGPVELKIELCSPHKRSYDISNRVKLLEDALVKFGIIEGDDSKIVQRLVVAVGDGFVGARVTLTPISGGENL